jgi:transcriptional regulator with PAS, ATPase and Fis domain
MKTSETTIEARHLPNIETASIQKLSKEKDVTHGESFEDISLNDFVEKQEKRYIQGVLEKNNNNKTITAKDLGISVRSLYYKMERYNIE